MLLSTIKSFMHFGIWGVIIRVLVMLVCAGIVLLIAWRKKNNTFCKTCKKRVHKFDTHCKSCGASMTEGNMETIIGVSKNTRTISVLALIILIGVTGLSVVAFASSNNFSGYGTGFYSDLHQTYTQNDSIWGIECERALTKGTFNKTIVGSGNLPLNLWIESSCESGTLILNMKQGDKVESVDISNTYGEIRYSLSDFDHNADIRLSVEHTTAENIRFKISWQ